MFLKICQAGELVLRRPSRELTRDEVLSQTIQDLIGSMFDTMWDAPGVGLAAPQIGVGLRVFTYHVSEDQQGHLINPVLHFPSDEEQDGPEGCLSVPGISVDCRRREHVVAHGQNMFGDPITIEGTALLARCVQHETDHLDGVMFLDRLDAQTRKQAMAQVRASDWWAAGAVVKLSPHPTMGGRF